MRWVFVIFICIGRWGLYASDGDLAASVGPVLYAANDSELTSQLAASNPGQHVVLTGTVYDENRVLYEGDVVVGADINDPPVVDAKYTFSGADSGVYGLDFDGGWIVMEGDRAFIKRCWIHSMGAQVPIAIDDGDHVVVANNEVYNWGNTSDCGARRGIRIRAPKPGDHDGARWPRISWNYIRDQVNFNPESCSPDAEVISVGYGGSAQRGQSELGAWIHHNFLVNCGGDKEGIGVKASYNTIEFNHLNGLRGFNNRHGGFNVYRGNRIENIDGSGKRHNRGGEQNWSIGEVTSGEFQVESGWYNFGETHGDAGTYMRSNDTRIIGSVAADFEIGVDRGNLYAINTLIEATNKAPLLLSNQSGTINDWDQSASVTVPTAITLTADDVGPLASVSEPEPEPEPKTNRKLIAL